MSRTLRVLNVEDSELDAALLARHLKRAGYDLTSDRVETAESMKAALESREWDVILCDYSMPQFNALAALNVVKEMGFDIPFIIISGAVGEAAAVEAMRAGVHDYLMKDKLARLAPTIERELHEAENRRARLQAEAELRKSEEFARRIIESSNDCIKVLDLEGHLLSMSRGGQRLLEIDDIAPYLNKSWVDSWKGKDREAALQAISKAREGDAGTFLGYRETAKGTPKWWDVVITPIADAQGNIERLLSVSRDITERRRVETALRESEERLRLAQQVALIGTFDWNIQTGVNQWTPELEAMYGLPPGGFAGTQQTWEELVHSEDRAEAVRQVALAMGGKNFEAEWRVIWPDGTVHWLAGRAWVFRDETGKPLRLLGVNIDITERKRAEAALREKSEELAAATQQLLQASKLATMGELSASIAHELNNPLATVGLRAETLLMQLPEDDQKRRSLEVITQEVDRMATLVSDLLQFSRRSHRQISTVDLPEEIANSVEFVQYHLRTRKIEVVRGFADQLPTIQADRQQLRQLFLNLLTNASDAMPQGGKLIVRAQSSVLDVVEAVAIDFADTGEGITPENLEKLWEPFFTTKPVGKGTGLGMAICRRIVEEHGGTISVQSKAGHGTTVRIVLPTTSNGAAANLL